MAGPPPLNNSMQPHLDGKRVQVPLLSHGFEPPLPRNSFETPPPGNRLQPLPSGSMPLPSASLCVNQQAPRHSSMQLPLPRDVLRQPPTERVLQHSAPRNMFQQPPPINMQLPPPINIQIPPPINMRQPPPMNMRQPPPMNMRQPPPINMQHPPPINMLQPPPINMRQPPSIDVQLPPPRNMRQPPPTKNQQHSSNMLQQPPPQSTMKLPGMSEPPPGLLYPPPCTLTSSQPSLELTAPQVLALPYTPLAGTEPQFGDVQFPPPRSALHRGKCVPNSFETPAVSQVSLNRPPPFAVSGISSDLSISEVFPLCSSSLLFGKSGEFTGSENIMSEISHPFINTSSGVPPSLVTRNIDCSVSAANACTISPFVSMPPPIPSLHEVLLSSSVNDKPVHNLTKSVSAIEIPRHPLNNHWISITKLQSNVDEWLSKKLNSESHDASLDQGDASNNRGHSSLEAQNSVLSHQEQEELKIILQESDFHDNERELLSSMLSLLCKQYRDFRLRGVHSCVAAYELLLLRLRGSLEGVSATAVKKLLDPLKCILSDQKFQELVKKLVCARTKKRQRKKKRKQFLRHEWDRKGKLIDARREQLQNLEREKIQESKLRAEADAVLKEVRGKQEEAESLQSLLWTLRDLRQHRLNRGEQQGYVSTQRDDECFNRVTDGLEKMIETQLSDYALEERTLQAMLQSCHPPTATTQSEAGDSDTVLSAATEALFGAAPPGDDALCASYCAADTSLEMLVARRRAWDGHIVDHKTDNSLASSAPCDGASGVPVCWVLPPHDPTPPWRQYLANAK